MTVSRVISFCVITFFYSTSFSFAAERTVFGGQSYSQHQLTQHEKRKIEGEFKNKLAQSQSNGYQKLGGNPWKAKKEKREQVNHSSKQISTWGQCREYSYKKRGQCYARGSNAYSCERYYDARVSFCNNKF